VGHSGENEWSREPTGKRKQSRVVTENTRGLRSQR
jgi:hypothetical protein